MNFTQWEWLTQVMYGVTSFFRGFFAFLQKPVLITLLQFTEDVPEWVQKLITSGVATLDALWQTLFDASLTFGALMFSTGLAFVLTWNFVKWLTNIIP